MLQKFFIADPPSDKQKDPDLKRFLPNLITIGSMICGVTAIQMATAARWQDAVLLIIVAAVLDMLDGAFARLLNACSKFGAQLDSLADFLSFGVAPATVMYLWILNDAGRVGWIAAIVYIVCTALRLARFNVQNEDPVKKPEWARYFFSGVPAPAGAGLLLLPIILYFQIDMDLSEYNFASPLIGIWTLISAALMVSNVPTFSSKQIRFRSGLIPALAVAGLMIAMLIHAPWMTLSILGILYILTLPISVRVYKQREKRGGTSINSSEKTATDA